jgi:hypothetical protein
MDCSWLETYPASGLGAPAVLGRIVKANADCFRRVSAQPLDHLRGEARVR